MNDVMKHPDDDRWVCCWEVGQHAKWCPHFSAEARQRYEVLGMCAHVACNAVMPYTDPPGRFLCYRPEGHAGPHQSPLPEDGVATWTVRVRDAAPSGA